MPLFSCFLCFLQPYFSKCYAALPLLFSCAYSDLFISFESASMVTPVMIWLIWKVRMVTMVSMEHAFEADFLC
jgi:hypothetical protein